MANQRAANSARASSAPATGNLEVFDGTGWKQAATVRLADPSQSFGAASRLDYDLEYLDRHSNALGARDLRALSCRFPLGYETHESSGWPPFLLDLMPAGPSRRYWAARLDVRDAPSSDWTILLAGAANPPGNVRVANAVENVTWPEHEGFPRSDILERQQTFIEYARQCGAPVSGSAGAGGESPKFLLREDTAGRWHADGALPDERTKRCWLVKFPRGTANYDKLILEAEAGYHRVARKFGVRTFDDVEWENDCLFVPRFDRPVTGRTVGRFGLESLYSLAGVVEMGATTDKEKFARAVSTYTTHPKAELLEFLARDILDTALANTDNHGRNTSVLKRSDGTVELSPIYDFAPMALDASLGIARVSRWQDGGRYPDWSAVAAFLGTLGLDVQETRSWLNAAAPRVAGLPAIMKECSVPDSVIEYCRDSIERVARALARA